MKIHTIEEVIAIAKTFDLNYCGVATRDLKTNSEYGWLDIRLPTPPNVTAWIFLLTILIDPKFKVSLSGDRILSGNGAIDGKLLPEYKNVLDKVNQEREKFGLKKIIN